MDEGLRLAYLAAMDIPVWLLRGNEPPPLVEPQPEPQRPPEPVPTVAESGALGPGRFARDLIGAAGAAPVAVQPGPRASAAARAAAAVATQPPIRLLLVSAGRYLFIDHQNDAAVDRRAVELIAAIAFALGGERAAARAEPFDWPPRGVAVDPAQARDALLGRLTKITETAAFESIVLLGERPAALLLGWDEARFRSRVPRLQRLPGLTPGVLVTHACAGMLSDPARKRAAWLELCAARSRHD